MNSWELVLIVFLKNNTLTYYWLWSQSLLVPLKCCSWDKCLAHLALVPALVLRDQTQWQLPERPWSAEGFPLTEEMSSLNKYWWERNKLAKSAHTCTRDTEPKKRYYQVSKSPCTFIYTCILKVTQNTSYSELDAEIETLNYIFVNSAILITHCSMARRVWLR